jgi:hypothetical protein
MTKIGMDCIGNKSGCKGKVSFLVFNLNLRSLDYDDYLLRPEVNPINLWDMLLRSKKH